MLLVGHRAFDQGDVRLREILVVGERRGAQAPPCRRDRSVARPDRGTTCGSRSSRRARPSRDAAFLGPAYPIHCFFSRAVTMYLRKPRSLRISATVLPLSKQRAGGAHLHALAAAGAGIGVAPGLAQVGDHAANSAPRPETSQVCAPSTSSQTRTQRVHRMQRLWSRPKRSWLGVHGRATGSW